MTMNQSVETGANPSLNGLAEGGGMGESHEINVDMREAIGVSVLGFMFFLVLMSMLRAQKRERKLLEKIAKLHADLARAGVKE
jgi:cbb3-type cytochrome oxidase subunit 3